MQKQELTELVDTDGDEIIDRYVNLSSDWPTTSNFHSFAFGLVHREGQLYGLFSVCVLPGGASCPEQQDRQGMLFSYSLGDGGIEFPAGGFRTPNGIALGPKGELLVNDNQGDWLPSSKLLHVEPGNFYGFRGIADQQLRQAGETPPIAWMPQDEIGNSPSEPAALTEGPYAGQVIYGDVYHGGAKRVYMEKVAGALQGAVFRFSGGFQGGVNRIIRGPEGALYLGEIGNPPNWGEVGKAWHGLERLSYRGTPAYEILEVRATPGGFDLVLSEPLAEGLEPIPGDLQVRQWFYHPTEQYGGPKIDPTDLPVTGLELSSDRLSLHAQIPGLKAGYVVYLALDRRLQSQSGETLWAYEAWYTLNAIPSGAGDK
jgi:cytochrome c